jgi:uncharacterized membrane protein (UPF0127 family)
MRFLLAALLALPLVAGGGGTVAVKGKKFMAEIAVTPAEQQKGLMYRQSLAADRCMVFLYEEDGEHKIWMKNCLISLDVAWVDKDGKVVETYEKAPPCSPMLGDNCPTYGGTLPARHFIEFPVGTFKRIGLKKGDKLSFEGTLDNGQTVRFGMAAKK